jgi:hypothetical protein
VPTDANAPCGSGGQEKSAEKTTGPLWFQESVLLAGLGPDVLLTIDGFWKMRYVQIQNTTPNRRWQGCARDSAAFDTATADLNSRQAEDVKRLATVLESEASFFF